MKITLSYFTSRADPRFSWFVESLLLQASQEDLDNMQIVFVDGKLPALTHKAADLYFRRDGRFPLADVAHHNWARRRELDAVVRGRFNYLHIPPLPCEWQGPFRLTKKDWFCAANARNTSFIVAEHPYIVCVDDLSILGPIWLAQVRHAAQNGYVVCGAYKKLLNMVVKDGVLESFTENPPGVDTRWGFGSTSGIVPWHGSAMYGCSFGVPTHLVDAVDGNDSYCNGAGAEDYDFGIRLHRAGAKFFYNLNMLTYESEEGHTEEPSLPREKKLVPYDRLPECLKGEFPNGLDSDHVMLQSVARETTRLVPHVRNRIAQLRGQWQRERLVQIPQAPQFDWRDGQALTDL